MLLLSIVLILIAGALLILILGLCQAADAGDRMSERALQSLDECDICVRVAPDVRARALNPGHDLVMACDECANEIRERRIWESRSLGAKKICPLCLEDYINTGAHFERCYGRPVREDLV